MNNPVTTTAGQHAQQRPTRAPRAPGPAASRCPGTPDPPGHEPESRQHNATPDDAASPVNKHRPRPSPICLHDGLLPADTTREPGQPSGEVMTYPMIRHPRPALPQRRPASTAASGHARGPAGDRVPGRAGVTEVTGPA
jgi:hypothetical protein